jgi:hypothetical protein
MYAMTFRNDFHNTTVTVHLLSQESLTEVQKKRLRRELCGHKGCTCGVVCGPQENETQSYIDTCGGHWDGDFYAGVARQMTRTQRICHSVHSEPSARQGRD